MSLCTGALLLSIVTDFGRWLYDVTLLYSSSEIMFQQTFRQRLSHLQRARRETARPKGLRVLKNSTILNQQENHARGEIPFVL